MSKERKKFLKRRMSWISIRVFTVLNGVLPLWWGYFTGRIMGNVAYLAAVKHRRAAIDNLSQAFKGASPREIRRVARESFVFMTQSSLELLYFLEMKLKYLFCLNSLK